MARTYRKSKIKETKEEYINRRIARLKNHYTVEYYMTEHDRLNYERAMEEYKIAYKVWLNSERCFDPCFWKRPKEPTMWEFKRRRYTKVEYDYDYEVERLGKEYDDFKRDGRLCETGRNMSFKKHCAKDLRHKNKEVINKILKDDESWEDKPFPDTYLGKQYVWDYW